MNTNDEIRKIEEEVVNEWQIRWNNDTRGRETFKFVNEVTNF